MCGICGVYEYKEARAVPEELLREMTARMTHRGPDSDGYLLDVGLGVGMRRLSIIDLAGGAQPIRDEGGRRAVMFNGEIYNFRQLRAELESKGHSFRTSSDTEVTVHAYEEWGLAGLRRLNGMYGLCIWDPDERRLVLARDPYGVKPLYYWEQDGVLVFGSEVRSVLAHPSVQARADLTAIDTLLTFTFVPSPATAFEGIRKLTPGHALVCDPERGVRVERFHLETPVIDEAVSEAEAIEELRRRIPEAVERQMMADVPIGVLLSGGVDSTALASMMSSLSGAPIDTFTVGFAGRFEGNELEAARATAERLGARHHEVIVSADDYLAFLPQAVRSLEEPIATSSTLAYSKVCELAHEHVKVVLTGQGADEPFGGYPRYTGERYGAMYRRLPAAFRERVVVPSSAMLPRSEKAKRAVRALSVEDPLLRMTGVGTACTAEMKRRLYRDGLPILDGSSAFRMWQEDVRDLDPVSQMLYVDTHTLLPDNLLLYGDKLSMAVSLEARVPYLDLDLMSFVESLPSDLKVRGMRRKYILKRALQPWVPREVLARRKVNFATPLDQWLRTSLRGQVRDMLLDPGSSAARYFHPKAIEQLLADHASGREDHTRVLLSLLTFELWHDEFISGVSTRTDAPLALRLPPATIDRRWYLRRLLAMPLEEIAARGVYEAKKTSWRRRLSWEAPEANVRPVHSDWRLPTLVEVDGEEITRLLEECRRTCDGEYDLLGMRYTDSGPDWHQDPETSLRVPLAFAPTIDTRDPAAVGNVKNIWEKNRHQHLSGLAVGYAVSGDRTYADEVARQLRDWVVRNPVMQGVNWNSPLELGIRMLSWLWIERLIRGSEVHDELFGAHGSLWPTVYWHLWLIEHGRSHGSSANNHLIGEGAALFACSCAWPWWPESRRWEKAGRQILEREILAQTFPSGASREQAFSYHLLSAGFMLAAAAEAERLARPFSAEFMERLRRMVEFVPMVMDVAGGVPRYGDSDDSLALQVTSRETPAANVVLALGAALLEAAVPVRDACGLTALLLTGVLPETRDGASAGSVGFGDAGLYVLASGRGTKDEILCLADAGPLGYLSIAAHGHADALSFALTVGGKQVVVDTGTYRYGSDPSWRSYFRSTAAHNTVEVDRRDQSEQAGPFLWTKKAKTHVAQWEPASGGGSLVAWTDGYERLQQGVRHERRFSLKGRVLSLRDVLTGEGSHEAVWRMHLAPDCSVELDDGTARIAWPGGCMTVLLDSTLNWEVARGGERSGWYSPGFNRRTPTSTLEGRYRGLLPVEIVTRLDM